MKHSIKSAEPVSTFACPPLHFSLFVSLDFFFHFSIYICPNDSDNLRRALKARVLQHQQMHKIHQTLFNIRTSPDCFNPSSVPVVEKQNGAGQDLQSLWPADEINTYSVSLSASTGEIAGPYQTWHPRSSTFSQPPRLPNSPLTDTGIQTGGARAHE